MDTTELCQRAYIAGYNEAQIAEIDNRAVNCPVLMVPEVAEAFADGVMHYSMERIYKTGRLVAYYGTA